MQRLRREFRIHPFGGRTRPYLAALGVLGRTPQQNHFAGRAQRNRHRKQPLRQATPVSRATSIPGTRYLRRIQTAPARSATSYRKVLDPAGSENDIIRFDSRFHKAGHMRFVLTVFCGDPSLRRPPTNRLAILRGARTSSARMSAASNDGVAPGTAVLGMRTFVIGLPVKPRSSRGMPLKQRGRAPARQ